MRNRFLFLGTGGSMGVPVISCTCKVCTSTSPFNKRLRPSGLLRVEGKDFLIDAGPDIRLQALRYGITDLDGALLTHSHFDHIAGVDDLRIFYYLHHRRFPCLLSEETLNELKLRYHYLFFQTKDGSLESKPFDFQTLKSDFGKVSFQGVTLNHVTYFQSGMKVTGYQYGTFAYISDIRQYEERLIKELNGVETLVLSALRFTPSEMHFNIDEAIDFAKRVGAKRTYLTHITHDLDHEETNAKLPSDIQLSYDGLEIEI